MAITRTSDINDDATYEEIGNEIDMKPGTAFMFNKRILEKVRAELERKGYSASDFFEVKE